MINDKNLNLTKKKKNMMNMISRLTVEKVQKYVSDKSAPYGKIFVDKANYVCHADEDKELGNKNFISSFKTDKGIFKMFYENENRK